MNRKAQTRGNPIKARWLAAVAGAALSLAPVYAHAQNAPSLNKALAGYSPVYSPVYPPGAPFASWLDMVSATQAAQPKWMTPLVTVTPRLEQEFRWDFYDQKNGTGTQGNGQRLISYGGPGARPQAGSATAKIPLRFNVLKRLAGTKSGNTALPVGRLR